MSERIKDGGSAFPVQPCGADGFPESSCEFGMSMRDYFAAKALPACIQKCVPHECLEGETMEQMFARKAFSCADAMLAVREVTKP